MPSSRQARMIRTAISPRLAMSTLVTFDIVAWDRRPLGVVACAVRFVYTARPTCDRQFSIHRLMNFLDRPEGRFHRALDPAVRERGVLARKVHPALGHDNGFVQLS